MRDWPGITITWDDQKGYLIAETGLHVKDFARVVVPCVNHILILKLIETDCKATAIVSK